MSNSCTNISVTPATESDVQTPRKFRGSKAEHAATLIYEAQKADSAAQGADRQYYSEFRRRAFNNRRILRRKMKYEWASSEMR